MFKDPYFYYKQIYNQSDELIICVDEQLTPVYITAAFKERFGYNPNTNALINCFIPSSLFGEISTAICNGVSESIDYVSIRDDQPKRCIIIPSTVSGKNYAALLIIEASSLSFDSRHNAKMKSYIAKAEKNVEILTSQLISDISFRNKDDSEFDLYSDSSFISILKIRKVFEELFMISNHDLRAKKSYPININYYIERCVRIIKKVLKDKVDISLDLTKKILATEISYEVFDVLVGTIIELFSRNSRERLKFYIKTIDVGYRNIVVFSDSPESSEALISELKDPENFQDNNLTVISSILEKQGGKLAITNNKTGGYSIAFSLPFADERGTIIREDSALSESKDMNSTLSTILMALMNDF